jgi:hypothetical protein
VDIVQASYNFRRAKSQAASNERAAMNGQSYPGGGQAEGFSGDDAGSSSAVAKTFTVQQANAALPLVKAITSDLATLSRDVTERRQRLAMLVARRERSVGDIYSEELRQIEEELEKDTDRLRELVEELRQLGVEPKGGPEGVIATVDFPSIVDGRLVYLCWRLGEAEVLFWHDLDAGFAGRQPLE